MKHKILAAVIALVGFGALAALPAASARTGNWKHPVHCKDGAKKVGDKCVCPDGRTYAVAHENNVVVYEAGRAFGATAKPTGD